MDANQDSGNEARRVINARWPVVAKAMDAINVNASSLPALQLDKSGPVPTLCVGDIRLASAWAPEKEATLQCSVVHPSAQHVTLFGVGMGYLPPLLLNRLPDDGTLTVVPLSVELFSRLSALIDMAVWLDDDRVELRLAESYKRLPVNTIVTPPELRFADPAAEPVRDWLLQKLSESHVQSYQDTNHNLIDKNISYHLQHHLADEDVASLLRARTGGYAAEKASKTANPSQCADGTCVVVGAGPSLDYSAATVQQLQQDGACIIAVDASLVSLMNRGIIPDCVVTIDPLDYVARLFDVEMDKLKNTSLVYFPTANHKVVAAWEHKRYSAIGSHSRFAEFNQVKASTVLFSSGSVIHPAVDLAVRSGAGKVYLAGADFGFPFELTHAQDSPYAADRKTVYADGQTVRNYRDETMASQINFISYYRDLEQYIGQQTGRGISFYNLGHHSAKIQQVNCLPVAA